MPRLRGHLFAGGELHLWLETAKESLDNEIRKAPEDYLVGVDLEEWVAHLAATHHVEPLVLLRGDYYLEDLGEAQVDVSGDRSRDFAFYTTSRKIPGRAVALHLPFTGNPSLLDLRPNTFTYSLPLGVVAGQEIVVRREWTDNARPNLKAEAEALADTLEQWMGWSGKRSLPTTRSWRSERANRSPVAASASWRTASIWTISGFRFVAARTRRPPTRRHK